MPTITIPLIGQPTQRGLVSRAAFTAGQDQRFINCLFSSINNSIINTKNVYVEKRQGAETYVTPQAPGYTALAIFASVASNHVISIFYSASVYTIHSGATNCGLLDGAGISQINEAIIGSISYVMFTTNQGTGWFLPSDARTGFTFTGDTHTNTTIDNISSLTGLYVGQRITGTGIAANTRIATITAPSTITTTIATTATNAGITITREGVAKIINANFPTSASGLVQMDGYIFTADLTNHRIYNSDLNTITTWSAQNYISTNISSDVLFSVGKYKDKILGFSSNSIEKFYNAGNASGSILSSDKAALIQIGSTGVITQNNEYLFFVGPNMLNPGIWMMSDAGIKKISTPPIDRDLYTTTAFASAIWSIFYGGYTYLILITVSGTVFFYCIELDSWNEQAFAGTLTAANGLRSISNTSGPLFAYGTTGIIYDWNVSPVYQDDGSAYTMTIQTEPKVLNGGKGFKIPYIDLLADNQSSGSTTLEISRDDYGTWQVLGVFNLTKTRKRITRCGYCRSSAAFRLTDSGNQPWRGQALVVGVEPCET